MGDCFLNVFGAVFGLCLSVSECFVVVILLDLILFDPFSFLLFGRFAGLLCCFLFI